MQKGRAAGPLAATEFLANDDRRDRMGGCDVGQVLQFVNTFPESAGRAASLRSEPLSGWTVAKAPGIPYLMEDERFEWRDAKAAENLRNHGIAFDKAAKAFADPFAIEWIDRSEAYGEERWNLLGMCEGVILHVTYTERGERIRIISARRAERHEQGHYYRQNAP